MKRFCWSVCVLLLLPILGCSQNDAHAAQARANHERRLAWQRAHPQEYGRQKAAERAEALRLAKARAAAQVRQNALARAAAAEQNKNDHPCDTALTYEKEAAVNNGYQSMYDLSVSGLHYAELCDDDNTKVLLKGYLLSFKANAEHHLSSGDSATDMDQATTLLAECQTLPGVYGTHAGAQCESQEDDDIRMKQQWDMANY